MPFGVQTGGVDPYPGGSGGGQVTQEGENILAEWNWDMGGMGDAFNSLLGRYGSMMDLGIEAMQRRAQQDPIAFDLYRRRREEELTGAAEDRARMRRGEAYDRSAMFAANRERQRENARRQQMERAAPTRMVTGPGVVPGRTLDVLAMSPWQRQAFLPQAAVPPKKDERFLGDQPSSLDWRSGISPRTLQYMGSPWDMMEALSSREEEEQG